MENVVVLIGKISNEIEIEKKNWGKVANLTIEVVSPFKNNSGNYDTDYINVECSFMADLIKEQFTKGNYVCIRGRLVSLQGGLCKVIGERITGIFDKIKND